MAENTVKNKGNTCHVTTGFKEGKEDKENQHLWNKAKNCTNTGNNTVKNQTFEPVCTTNCLKATTNKSWNTRNPDSKEMISITKETVICPVCSSGTNSYHRNIVNKPHDKSENWKGQPAVCNYTVNLIRCAEL